MAVKIFPYSLVRYASLNHQVFNAIAFKHGEKLIETHYHYLKSREDLAEKICDTLFPVISQQTDDQLRQKLINIKRRVFNYKKITAEHLALIKTFNSESLFGLFEAYFLNQTALENFYAENEPLYQQSETSHQKTIQQLALLPELQNGLMLSSPVLYLQLKDFVEKNPEKFRQKELRIEFSLLRYLSRMAFKTSPFSSFTFTGVMTMESNRSNRPLKNMNVQSKLKLNNMLFEYLRSIFRQHPFLNEYLLVKTNITVEIVNDKIQFLTNYNNIESFQQLPASGLQLLVVNYLQNAEQPVTLAALTVYLAEHVEDSSREELKAYLLKLISTGLFEIGFGFSGMDENWAEKLLAFFQVADNDSLFGPLISLFSGLLVHLNNYATANTAQRYQMLQAAEAKVNHTFQQLQEQADLPFYSSADEKKYINHKDNQLPDIFLTNTFVPYYFSARNIFFEDCFTDEAEVLPEPGIEDFAEKLNLLAKYLLPLDVMRKERIKMKDFYKTHYTGLEKIKLTTFYRDYYFHVKKPEKAQSEAKNNPLVEVSDWKKAILAKLNQLVTSTDTLNLTDNFFENLPLESDLATISSIGAFVQFQEHDQQFYGVVNSLLPGMGKVSGRFLSLFDSVIQEEFIAKNEAINPGVIKAELNDASTFNANIHPPLLKHELVLPSGNHVYPAAQLIKVGDLCISLDTHKDYLKLLLDDREVHSYDLSLESFYNRSNLYQLLAHFNPNARISLQPFIQLVDEHYRGKLGDEEPDVYLLPRIVFEGTVIIRRRTWRVKTSVIPIQQQVETDFEYFIRLNSWFKLQQIPTKFFLFLRKRAYQGNAVNGENLKKEGLHDDYKPQYLAFDQPLLVGMFNRLLARAGNYITIEEVLPLPAKGGVKEYLIQWYNE